MGKETKKECALHCAQRSSMTRMIGGGNDKHIPSTTEPGALAVNPLSPVTSDSASSRSFHSDSSTHLLDTSHTTSDSLVTSPVVTAARRKTHLLTSIPIDVQRNISDSSAAEPTGVGAHAMTTTRSSALPMTHKLQALPAGSHAALSRQAHNANSKQRLSLSSSSHHSSGIRRTSARSVLGTSPTNESNRTLGASSFADQYGESAGLRRSSDRRATKMGLMQGQSSRQSVGSVESTGKAITGEVDVDELQLHVGMKTAVATESSVAEYDVTVPALSNMVSAHLVVEDEEDEEEGGGRRMTEEERNALFEQAQRQAEEALHEKMMSNMVTAEEVVDEEALKQQARRLQCWTRCGLVALIVLVGGILGATKPWKNDEDPMDMMHGPPPPINDVCTAAITMEWGTDTQWQDGTTIGASDSKLPSCTSDDEFVWGKSSVWYRIVGTGSPLRIASNSTLDTEDDDGLLSNTTIPWNAVLSVYSGQCGALMCIGSTSSNEDPLVTTTDVATDHDASVTWFAEVGVEYFVCVHGAFREEGTMEDDPYSGTTYGNGRDVVDANPDDAPSMVMMTAGNFSLSVDQAVGNDFCPGAVDLEVSKTDSTMTSSSSHHYYHQGSTNQATADSEHEFCGNTQSTAPGVWYRVNGTGTPLEVIVRPQEDDNFNTQVTVFKSPMGLDCSELVCITGDNELFQHSSHVTWLSEAGTVYFILVHGASNHRGSFELVVEERVSNDLCESARALQVPEGNLSGEGNTLVGTFDGSSLASSLGVCGSAIHAGRSVWYTLEGTGEKMRMSTCHSTSYHLETIDTVLSVFRGEDCSNLECIDGNDSLSCGSTSIGGGSVTWDTEVGQLYRILVSGKPVEETGTFQLSWEPVL